MNERLAIERVEKRYGTLEEFAVFVLTEAPEVLEDGVNPLRKVELTGLDEKTLSFLSTKSPKFRVLMRSAIANGYFGLAEEAKHIKEVVNIATNKGKKVVSNKGNVVEVDNLEKAIIDAGRYLNEYRGTPLEAAQKAPSLGINVVFGVVPGANGRESLTLDAEAAVPGAQGDDQVPGVVIAGHLVRPHAPLRPGQLPPPATLARYGGVAAGDGQVRSAVAAGSDLDFATANSPTSENPVPTPPPPRRTGNSRPAAGFAPPSPEG